MFEPFFPSSEDFPLRPPPGWWQALLTGICVLTILLPKGPIRLSTGAVVLTIYFYLLFWTQESSRSGYLSGITSTGLVLKWIDFIAIHDLEQDFWEVKSPQDRSKIQKCPGTVWRKLVWSFKLWNSMLGVGWNIQPTKLAPPPTSSRRQFLWGTMRDITIMYIRLDLVQIMLKYVSDFFPASQLFFTYPIATQVLLAWMKAFRLHHSIHLLYFIMSLVTVLLHLYEPKDWPPIMGSFKSEAYTIRKMWGTCWHQMMRRPCSEAGKVVKTLFGFRTGSFLSKYSQLWVGFAVSAGIHHASAKIGVFEDGGHWQAAYFGVQSAGIMFEDGVIGLGKRVGVRNNLWTRRLGFVWIICWFSWTLRWMVAYNPRSWIEQFDVPSLIDWIMGLVLKGQS